MIESFEWVQKCIQSVNGPWQLQTAMNLIRRFEAQYGQEASRKYVDVLTEQILEIQAVMAVD